MDRDDGVGLSTWALPFLLGPAVLEGTLDPVGRGFVLAARTVGFLVAVPVAGVLATGTSEVAVEISAPPPDTAPAATPVTVDGFGAAVSVPSTVYGGLTLLGATSVEAPRRRPRRSPTRAAAPRPSPPMS